jgi:hypothetical protein
MVLLAIWLIHAFWSRVAKRKEKKARNERKARNQKMVRPAHKATEHCLGFLMEPERLA